MRRFAITFVVLLVALFAFELTPPGQAIVQPWTALVAQASAGAIRAFDGSAVSQGNALYDAKTGFGVTIVAGCNGVEAMLVLLAGILAYPAPWRSKAIGLAIGLVAIQGLNLVRIVSLFYLGQWDAQWFEWAHLYVWQALIMLDALIVWLLWMRSVPDREPAVPAPAA
ncbi:exosortase H [Betaproteobacteria bacterium GR16-43]|nr:exosortase H [Betaproteobacteria bacterium GR16-43]